MRQLLQHRSGLPNPDTSPAADNETPAFYRQTAAEAAGAATGYCARGGSAPPADGWSYNNCDYLVLGALLEALTGKPYATLLDGRIARPLGLSTLRLAPDGADGGGAAAIGYDGARRYPPVNVATFGASGALTGSARDLALFDRALMTGSLLGPLAREQAWTGVPALGYQALGVWSFEAPLKGCTGAVRLIERRGDVGGTQVRNIIAPQIGRAIAIFTNDVTVEFGEVWQGAGLTHDLLSAAFCPATRAS